MFTERFGRVVRRKPEILALLVPLTLFSLTLNGTWSSDYPASILGSQYAMWVRHSFDLGTQAQPLVRSVDLALYQGHYYSAISPGFAILSLPFAAVGFLLDGNSLNYFGHAVLMDELFLAICSSVACLFVYEIARLYASAIPSLLASATLAFATPLWPFSTVIFIQGTSVMFAAASVYFLLRHVKERSRASLVASGILLGLAGFVEYAALLLVLPMAFYLVARSGKLSVPAFLGSFSLGPLAHFAYNASAFGNPLIFPEELKVGASGGLLSRFDLVDTLGHAVMYIESPYRGILFFSPVVALGFYSLFRMMRSRSLRAEGALFLSIFALIVAFYSSWNDWAGGLAYGPRFLMLTLPALVVPIAILLDENPSRGLRFLFVSLFGLSSFIEGVGALTTAFSVQGSPLTYQPLALNVWWFLQGRVDSWLIAALGVSDSATALILSSIILLSPLLSAAIWVQRGFRATRPPAYLDATGFPLHEEFDG